MEIVRRLTESGLRAFEDFIEQADAGAPLEVPRHVLVDQRYSEDLQLQLVVSTEPFSNRFAMGEHLVAMFGEKPVQRLLGDAGFWGWLALLWFDQLCPRSPNGGWKPAKRYNYLLSPNYNHRPRHALRTSWMLVHQYGESARFLLGNAPDKRGDLVEQLAARQYYISCEGVIRTASRLYLDPERGTFKRGSATRTRPGNIRRYINFLQQLELTYDLYALKEEQLVDMLPGEYSKFLADAA